MTEWLAMGHTRVLLVSTYEMGRQPFGLASPAAWLRRDGHLVDFAEAAKGPIPRDAIEQADLIAFHLPMHTATRLAGPLVRRARELNPRARLCAYGLYAPLNADWLRTLGVTAVLGGEFEEELTALARAAGTDAVDGNGAGDIAPRAGDPAAPPRIPRLAFVVPDRTGLLALDQYASLQMPDGSRRLVAYTEASRGCRHLCRHCPVVPVYNGQFRIVPPAIVQADLDAQIAAGARHVTFGDPDFFNGPTHALRVAEALHAAHPDVTYDVTIKVEHLIRHRELLPRLAATGCLFVTSAVESFDDHVLAQLDKGHTRRDAVQAVSLCRAAGVTLVPTFVAFHPWTTLASYCSLLETVEELGLVDHVAPIQLAIRLLLPDGSRLLELEEVRRATRGFDAATLCHRWVHPDPRVDSLHREVAALVGAGLSAQRRELFEAIATLAHERAALPRPSSRPARDRSTVPYLNEPWYC